jgi:transglutaminase-like putative cysteine protease
VLLVLCMAYGPCLWRRRLGSVGRALAIGLPLLAAVMLHPFAGFNFIGCSLLLLLGAEAAREVRHRPPVIAGLVSLVWMPFSQLKLNPSLHVALFFALAVWMGLVGIMLLAQRESERQIARYALPGVEFKARRRPGTLRSAVLTGMLLMFAVGFFYLSLGAFGAAPQTADIFGPEEELEDAARREAERERTAGERKNAESDASEMFFPDAMDLAGGLGEIQFNLVLLVHPKSQQSLGPLYMRGMLHDSLGPKGAFQSLSPNFQQLRPAASGRIRVAPENGAGPFETLEITQQSMRFQSRESGLLLTPPGLLEFKLPELSFDPDGYSLVPATSEDWFTYEARVDLGRDFVRGPAQHADPRYLQLPANEAAMERIYGLAQRLSRGTQNDGQRVARTLNYFHTEFTYSLEAARFPGLAGIVSFLDQKSGFCTYYAAASSMILRSMGISTRVATGFLGDAWDADERAYVINASKGHAWIEVYFEDAGWVTFDPTPAGADDAALAALDAALSEDLSAWLAGLRYDFERWLETGDRRFLSGLFDRFGEGALGLVRYAKGHPWQVAALLGSLVLLWIWRRGKPGARSQAAQSVRFSTRAEDLYLRLLRALEQRGHQRPAASTLREFALGISSQESEIGTPFLYWTDRFYSMRYGGEALSLDEAEELRAYGDQLLSRDSPPLD